MGNSSHRFLDLFAIGSSEDRPDAQDVHQGKLPIELVVKADELHHTSVRNPGPPPFTRPEVLKNRNSEGTVSMVRPFQIHTDANSSCRQPGPSHVSISENGSSEVLVIRVLNGDVQLLADAVDHQVGDMVRSIR